MLFGGSSLDGEPVGAGIGDDSGATIVLVRRLNRGGMDRTFNDIGKCRPHCVGLVSRFGTAWHIYGEVCGDTIKASLITYRRCLGFYIYGCKRLNMTKCAIPDTCYVFWDSD